MDRDDGRCLNRFVYLRLRRKRGNFFVYKSVVPPEPEVRFLEVDAQVTPGFVTGSQLTVSIELETETDMGFMPPSFVRVRALCEGGGHDDGWAFFGDFHRRGPGVRLSDHVSLRMRNLPRDPSCDITLSLDQGQPSSEHYCFSQGRTRPGRC